VESWKANLTFPHVKDLAQPRYLVDAGPLIALLNRRDQWHAWAEQALEVIAEPLWTSEVVLAEVCYNLGQNTPAVRQFLALVQSRHVRVVPAVEENVAQLIALMTKYERMDVCDGSLVVLSEQYLQAKIITVDTRDFPVYRRFGREPLPLIMPH
jgi:predicted nucleic acid-binding protein